MIQRRSWLAGLDRRGTDGRLLAGTRCRRMAQESRTHHRALPAGRPDRYGGTAHRPAAAGDLGTGRRHRLQARRGNGHRRRLRSQVAARRADHRDGEFVSRRQSFLAPRHALPHAARHRRHHADREPATRAGRPAGRPFNTLAELVAYAKKRPGKLTYGTPGAGSTTHLGAELLKRETGIDMLHSPFKGSAPAHTELMQRGDERLRRARVSWPAAHGR